jgi:hypothetical protein
VWKHISMPHPSSWPVTVTTRDAVITSALCSDDPGSNLGPKRRYITADSLGLPQSLSTHAATVLP